MQNKIDELSSESARANNYPVIDLAQFTNHMKRSLIQVKLTSKTIIMQAVFSGPYTPQNVRNSIDTYLKLKAVLESSKDKKARQCIFEAFLNGQDKDTIAFLQRTITSLSILVDFTDLFIGGKNAREADLIVLQHLCKFECIQKLHSIIQPHKKNSAKKELLDELKAIVRNSIAVNNSPYLPLPYNVAGISPMPLQANYVLLPTYYQVIQPGIQPQALASMQAFYFHQPYQPNNLMVPSPVVELPQNNLASNSSGQTFLKRPREEDNQQAQSNSTWDIHSSQPKKQKLEVPNLLPSKETEISTAQPLKESRGKTSALISNSMFKPQAIADENDPKQQESITPLLEESLFEENLLIFDNGFEEIDDPSSEFNKALLGFK